MYPRPAAIRVPDPGGAVATVQKANDSAAAGEYHLDACRNLQLHESNHAFEERNIGHQSHQDLGVYGRGAYSRTSRTTHWPAVVGQASNHRDRSWMHLKGLEIANGKVGSSGSHSYSMLRTKNASNNTFELPQHP